MNQMERISEKRMETMARVVRGMQANDCFGKQMQCIKKESDVQANAVRKEHAEDMADVLLVWKNEERSLRAFWDADVSEDDALHKFKAQSATQPWESPYPMECLHVSAFELIPCHMIIVDVLIAGGQTIRAVELRVACLDARHKSPPRRGLLGFVSHA